MYMYSVGNLSPAMGAMNQEKHKIYDKEIQRQMQLLCFCLYLLIGFSALL